jgi:hypothetical protein
MPGEEVMTCHYRKENYCTLKGKSAIPNFPDTHQFCEIDCQGMQELRQRAEQAENALANRNSLLFADIDNLQRELKQAEARLAEAKAALLKAKETFSMCSGVVGIDTVHDLVREGWKRIGAALERLEVK